MGHNGAGVKDQEYWTTAPGHNLDHSQTVKYYFIYFPPSLYSSCHPALREGRLMRLKAERQNSEATLTNSLSLWEDYPHTQTQAEIIPLHSLKENTLVNQNLRKVPSHTRASLFTSSCADKCKDKLWRQKEGQTIRHSNLLPLAFIMNHSGLS